MLQHSWSFDFFCLFLKRFLKKNWSIFSTRTIKNVEAPNKDRINERIKTQQRIFPFFSFLHSVTITLPCWIIASQSVMRFAAEAKLSAQLDGKVVGSRMIIWLSRGGLSVLQAHLLAAAPCACCQMLEHCVWSLVPSVAFASAFARTHTQTHTLMFAHLQC